MLRRARLQWPEALFAAAARLTLKRRSTKGRPFEVRAPSAGGSPVGFAILLERAQPAPPLCEKSGWIGPVAAASCGQ
jgi:hypothetical protein